MNGRSKRRPQGPKPRPAFHDLDTLKSHFHGSINNFPIFQQNVKLQLILYISRSAKAMH
jgi:hypothetical protein